MMNAPWWGFYLFSRPSAVWQLAWRLWTALRTAQKWWKWRMSPLSSLWRSTPGRASATSSTVAGKILAWSLTRLRMTSSLYRRRMRTGPILTGCITLVSCLNLNICRMKFAFLLIALRVPFSCPEQHNDRPVKQPTCWIPSVFVQECLMVAEKTHYSTRKSPRKSAKRPS